ncbi:UNVERIFIED_CONTAM: hypothetical protein FKN15_000390 [Acipenser sinensis]
MSRKQAVKPGHPHRKCSAERKRDERAVRRALAKERRNRAQGGGADEDEEEDNCLFRALGDQLEGHSRNHLKLRRETVEFMIAQRHDFEPFVEDDVPFEKHVASLGKSGTFAGNDAIVAFARNHGVTVVIHQVNTLSYSFSLTLSNSLSLSLSHSLSLSLSSYLLHAVK